MQYNNKNVLVSGIKWNIYSPKEILKYCVGSLLYVPAIHKKISDYICLKRYEYLKSVALCLEDSILDKNIKKAENDVIYNINKIYKDIKNNILSIEEDLPLIFIRVRTPEQMIDIFERMGESSDIIAGFIAPKFSTLNMDKYISGIKYINKMSDRIKYIMPIIESNFAMDKNLRYKELSEIKKSIDIIKENILNVRVGGNDFCNLFGLRRSVKNTIYDIAVVRDVLSDVINFFSVDYVISAPVWEYFGNDTNGDWCKGLKAEVEMDKLNGFIGKTAIHPSQLPIIQESYIINKSDYEDAKSIIYWENSDVGVGKTKTMRMNEVKTHEKWARKILSLANIYGVKEVE